MSDSEAYTLYQKGLAALADGHADEAIVPLERAKRLEPTSMSINEALGKSYYKTHFFERALDEFETILAHNPTDHYAHFCAARCYDKLRQLTKALSHYKLACHFQPDRDVYRNTLERFCLRESIDYKLDGPIWRDGTEG